MNYTKRFLLLLSFAALLLQFSQAQTCNSNGNVILFSNYDGGIINIQCDVNIPNLKIGVCTYEDCTINITGPFASNVTAVRYAGFQGDNNHCNYNLSGTTINGVAAGITTVLFAPTATIPDANGNPNIICAFECGNGNQGGCNTSAQIVAYFMSVFGGTLRAYHTQYGCWFGQTFVTSSATCCTQPQPQIAADFVASDPIVCVGQCIQFTDLSTQNPTQWQWTFGGALTSASSGQNPGSICFQTPGAQQVTLIASNANSTSTVTKTIQVLQCGIPGCTYSNASNYNSLATVDDQSCVFPPCANSCPADLNNDGVVSVADLLLFIALYGSQCPD